ncbi:MAG TPA: hypothetical protein VLF14_12575 [Candidatus Binatia bacterium]|nr:hypothetical protein [Candidatus Binatia bacterium]
MRPWSKLRRAAPFGFAALLGLSMTATSARAQMLGRTELFLSPTSVTAQMLQRTELSLSFSGETKAISLFSTGTGTGHSAGVDYAVFATELVAFLTKEVLRESADEFDNTLLGSHLSPSMPSQRSEFGSHCLTIITRLGSQLPLPSPSSSMVGSTSTLDYAVRAVTAGLALRQVWSAFRNHVEDNRSGVSLNPKIGARRVGVKLTFRW